MTRSGQEYPEGLRDGREVRLDGQRVEDVTAPPAFRATAASFAGLLDLADHPVHRPVLVRGGVRRAGAVPRSYEDLVARRRAFRTTAETAGCRAALLTGAAFAALAALLSVRPHLPARAAAPKDRVPDPY
ncbi:hypothetical protein GCM10010275_00890 [Streptomyces litmocidini]|uniref:4-hydroxyphenylacetate 3-hydroxylase N-terminal domain-containing protein n=1 Tax=Streptomyces litmocidini TaxID=67318 RepID=UPI0019A2676F|nr:4-hydroxyphenylacetate 3-hydroxylase N-terminal domain-containing protein [Streptomyces litmocidini]GGU70780.1 hypothetical protein GCM10010275_00890 [Streptomyces litmocidini]